MYVALGGQTTLDGRQYDPFILPVLAALYPEFLHALRQRSHLHALGLLMHHNTK